VVVLFGWDDPEQSDDQLVARFQAAVGKIDPKYKNAQIEIWRQNTLLSFILVYPSLALKINGRARARFDTHLAWSNQEQMRTIFVAGKAQSTVIEGIKNQLRGGDSC